MKPIFEFNIKTNLPESLKNLEKLAENYWWSWNAEAKELFHLVDRDLFVGVDHNPIALLNKLSKKRIKEIEKDLDFLNKLELVSKQFDKYMNEEKWYNTTDGDADGVICYFSPEYGINESFPNYSGGLGVLSGDHLKSASDLGLPLVAIGLLYQEGYFRQRLAQNGWQNEVYLFNDFYSMPLELQKDMNGNELLIHIQYPDGIVFARIWKLNVGRVKLYLLDTNIDKNQSKDHRLITNRLYGGDRETRIQQEIMLGMGGVKALNLMGIEPRVFHINEGHAAFALLERTKLFMEKYNVPFEIAKEITKASSVFTTHTPVPAGNETFVRDRMEKYLKLLIKELNIDFDEFYKYGISNGDLNEKFSMTILGLNLTAYANGVSKLHGEVARDMWKDIWKNYPKQEIPIQGLTNGIHTHTWIASELKALLDIYLTDNWVKTVDDEEIWKSVNKIPDSKLWEMKNRRRARLVDYTREHLTRSETGYLTNHQLRNIKNYLSDDALTIGFARRFATYKRSNLIFTDMERLKRLINNADRPLQILIAGKAHPHDIAGKETIMEIIQKVKEHNLEEHIIFLEDYDMVVGRLLVKGCDVWLNNPIRPLEASGTSGMKAALNGGLNLSILDGWWDEGFNEENGFAIGNGEEYEDKNEQRIIEANELYDMLEYEVIPMFYNRNKKGLPTEWLAKVKNAISTVAPYFSTERMVKEYATSYYLPASFRFLDMNINEADNAKQLKLWLDKIKENWNEISIFDTYISDTNFVNNESIYIKAKVYLSDLNYDDVSLEVYYGKKDAFGLISEGQLMKMSIVEVSDKVVSYDGFINPHSSGMFALSFRLTPNHKDIKNFAETHLIKWA